MRCHSFKVAVASHGGSTTNSVVVTTLAACAAAKEKMFKGTKPDEGVTDKKTIDAMTSHDTGGCLIHIVASTIPTHCFTIKCSVRSSANCFSKPAGAFYFARARQAVTDHFWQILSKVPLLGAPLDSLVVPLTAR